VPSVVRPLRFEGGYLLVVGVVDVVCVRQATRSFPAQVSTGLAVEL